MTSFPDIMFDPQTVLNTLRMIETSVQVVLFFRECLRKCLAFFGNFPKGFEKVRVADKFWKSSENGQKFSESDIVISVFISILK